MRWVPLPPPFSPLPSPLTPSPRALSLQPKQAGVHSAMDYTLQLMGQLDEAIQQYLVALSAQPDDAFTRNMLTKALHDFAMLSRLSVVIFKNRCILKVDG